METYRIVVPSRGRVKNMPRLLGLLPKALVCVAESEQAAYRQAVPRGQLITHQKDGDLVGIRNWILDTVEEDCVVQVDDDLRSVISLTGSKRRRITDPDTIREVIENSLRVSTDLDIGIFCFSRTQNPVMIDVRHFPIRLAAPMASGFGIRGPARQRRFDPRMVGREDLDFTLQSLLEDRIVYTDMRFYFDFGRTFSGRGGNAGQIGPEQFKATSKLVAEKWGQFVSFERPGWQRKRAMNVHPMSIRVRRRKPAIVSGQ